MKNCPVCGSACFDDMEICFDCLHQFGGQESEEQAEFAPIGKMANEATPFVSATEPVVFAEYSKVPSDCSEGTDGMHCVTLHIQVPEGMGEFSIRCENLRIEGTLR